MALDGTMNDKLQVPAISNPFESRPYICKGFYTIIRSSKRTVGYPVISMDLWRAQYKRHQPLYEDLAGKVSLVAALLGGSQLYCASDKHDTRHISDWDGALFVAKKLDIVVLVNEYRHLLMTYSKLSMKNVPSCVFPDLRVRNGINSMQSVSLDLQRRVLRDRSKY